MAQGSIRKGFFFYFGLFVLLLVTAFLICLVIMMFNPGKNVLGMTYFNGKKSYSVESTTAEQKGDSKLTIDYATLTDIEINCDYADITVQRNKEYRDDGIFIRNYAKGFSTSKKYSPFEYKAKLEGTKLIITLEEPDGFIYFSKDIEVVINDDSRTEGKFNFENINLKVNAKGGSTIYLGGTTNHEEKEFSMKSIDLSTKSGRITLGKRFNPSLVTGKTSDGINGIKLYSRSGRIETAKEINWGTKVVKGLRTSANVSLGTYKGRINFGVVDLGSSGNLELKCKKGAVAIDHVVATKINVANCVNGNYKFKTISCDVEFLEVADTIISPIITIDDLAGNFSLLSQVKKSAPVVKIKKAQKNVAVTADKGSVTISNAMGQVDLNSSASMGVNVTVNKENTNNIRIENGSGKVKLKFLGAVSRDARILTTKSEVSVSFTKDANFTAECHKGDRSTKPASSKDVIVKLGKSGVKYDYNKTSGLLTFEGSTGSGKVVVHTNNEMTFSLVA